MKKSQKTQNEILAVMKMENHALPYIYMLQSKGKAAPPTFSL